MKNLSAAPDRSRLRRRVLKGLAAGGMVLAGATRTVRAADAHATLRLGFIGPARAPVGASGYALARGDLARALAPLGFTSISTHVFPNGPDLNEAFVAQAIDVGIYGDTPAVVARAHGLDARLIGFEETGMDSWLLTPRGGVPDLHALHGRTVGVPLGSYMHRYLLGALDGAGLKGRVHVVYMLGRDAEPVLDRGSIDAFAAPIDLGPLLASRGFPVIDTASRHTGLLGSGVIVASSDILRRAPRLPAAWHRARSDALASIRQNSDAYYAFHAAQTGYPVDVVVRSHPLASYPQDALPTSALQGIDSLKHFLLAEHLIQTDYSLSSWLV